ncbi:hypothetical protein RHSIM_Rhsim03G0126900 [Rhododendron simsii]|uniref:Uncharacterized protein n=1 Tax=Rhododendron simsii TaxID=118357 RepID=A0A834H751_RHOSS|nr:hypothetical protein RHSIM_Rhsim03G0126900 [Rhododendron simsii]
MATQTRSRDKHMVVCRRRVAISTTVFTEWQACIHCCWRRVILLNKTGPDLLGCGTRRKAVAHQGGSHFLQIWYFGLVLKPSLLLVLTARITLPIWLDGCRCNSDNGVLVVLQTGCVL